MKKLAAGATAFAVLLSATPAFAEDVIVNGDVLYFQDMKEFEPRVWKDGTEHGGMARLATVLNEARTRENGALVASGGDVASGTLFNAVYRGKPFIDAFNELGVDVANFGNHDFDFGAPYALELVNKSNFPWISSNLTDPAGTPFSPDGTSVVIHDGDLKIGFLTLSDDLDRTPASRDVIVQDFFISAQREVKKLKADNVDSIILLSQISKDDTQKVMEAIPEIDAALREENSAQSPAEHSQTKDGRWVVAPEADYGTVEHLDITKNRTTGAVSIVPTSLKVGPDVAEDPIWVEKSKQYYGSLDETLGTQVGSAGQDLTKEDLGYLVADSYRSYFGTEIGIQNGGGQRAEIAKGPVTLRDLKSVLPFGNSVTSVTATGAQLRLLLEQGIQSNPNGGGGFPRTAGLKFEFDPSAEFGKRITHIELASGEPFNDKATYSIALSRFIADGGDGMTAVRDATRTTSETPIDADVFEKYIRAQPSLKPYEFGNAAPVTDPAYFNSSRGILALILSVLAGLSLILPLAFAYQIDAILGPLAYHPVALG